MKVVSVKRIIAFLLCVVLTAGILSLSVFSAGAPDIPTAVPEEKIERISVPLSPIVPAAESASSLKPAVAQQVANKELKAYYLGSDRPQSKALRATSTSEYSYSLGITPKGSGTVDVDWNKSTKVLTLTAKPASGCTFLYWTEFVYDAEIGEEVEKLITDSDPFSKKLSYTVQPYVSRGLVANFRKNGEYFIWNGDAYSEKGTMTVTPVLDSIRPGTQLTVKASPNSGYRVVGIEYGLAVKDGIYGDEDVEWMTLSDSDTATLTMPSSDVWIRAVFWSTSPHKATILNTDPNGTVTFEDGSTYAEIVAGEKVKLLVTPKETESEKYRLSTIYGVGNDYDFDTSTFTMPDQDLEIHADFTKRKAVSISFDYDGDYLTLVFAQREDGLLVLVAVPKNNSILFTGWYDENDQLLCEDMAYTFYPERDMTLKMKHAQGYYCAPVDQISSTVIEHGTVSVYPENLNPFYNSTISYYLPGTTVRLIGTPDEGYMLDSFYYAEVSGSSVSFSKLDGDTVTIGTSNITVTALFVPAVDINVSSNDDDAGTALGGARYKANTIVTVTAVPNEGYEFVNWTENGNEVSTSAEYQFYATKSRDLVANFRKMARVDVISADETLGTVSGEGYYSVNSQATVKAVPNTDCVFVNWTKNGTEVSTSAEYTFTVTEDTELVAHFRALNEYTVTVQSSNEAHGTVSGGGKVKEGSSVTVVATPAEDYYFVRWTKDGTEVSTESTYTFTPDGDVTLIAVFEHVQEFSVTVASEDENKGTVSGSGTFKTGASATVTATAKDGFLFVNWTRNGTVVSTEASYTFTVTEDVSLVAHFRALAKYTITVQSSNSEYGTVSGGGTFNEGASVTVTATPKTDCRFVEWKIGNRSVSTSPQYTFKAEADVTLVAVFAKGTMFTITFLVDGEYVMVDRPTMLTNEEGRLNEIPTPTFYYNYYDFYSWVFVRNGKLCYVDTYTVFTQDTSVVALYDDEDMFDDTSVQVGVAPYDDYGTASAVESDADVGDTVHLKAAANPGFRFVKWFAYGYEYDILFDDVYSPETTYVRGMSSEVYAIFDYDLPDRTITVDIPRAVEIGKPLYFTATITSKADMTIQEDPFFALNYYYESMDWDAHRFAGGGGVTILSKTFEGNTCTMECELPFGYLKYPYLLELGLGYGVEGKNIPDITNYVYVVHHQERCEPTATATGNIEYWYSESPAKYFLDKEGKTEITYEQTIIPMIVYYTVTFKNDDGTVLQSGEVLEGDTPVYTGTTPVKASTVDKTFTFAGWTPAITAVTGDATYTATYTEAAREYTVTFKNEDGTELQSGKVAYGETPAYTGSTPEKAATADKTFTFAGWTPAIASVTGDATYTATYTEAAREYTVTFKNEDGTVLQTGKAAYGSTPSYTGTTPVKASTADKTFTFAGWTPEIAAVTGDATYTATYTEAAREYTVTFKNEDGTVLQTGKAAYGSTPSYTGSTPEKTATADKTFTFAGWTPEIAAVDGDATYTATYTEAARKYTVKFVNEDGTELQSGEVAYGETPAYAGSTPEKAATADKTFTFAGWTPAIASVTGDATYTATYTEDARTYTVKFVNEDGTELQSGEVAYGETPAYTGSTPEKAATAEKIFTFAGWTPGITAVTGDATYTATYTEAAVEYLITLYNEDGTVIGIIKTTYGESIPEPEKPIRDGYDFTGWFTDQGCTEKASFPLMLNGDQTLYAGWEAFSYTVEGNTSWNGNDAEDLSLTITRSRNGDQAFDLFKGIVFNGQQVSDAYYTAEKGSVKLTVKSELFEGLASGEYELAVQFADGEVKVAVTVEQKQEQTLAGDSGILLWLLLAAGSVLSIAAVCAYGRKRRSCSF